LFKSSFWPLSPGIASLALADWQSLTYPFFLGGHRKGTVESEIIYHSRLETEKSQQFSLEEYSVFVRYLLLWPICFCVSVITLERFPLFTLIIPEAGRRPCCQMPKYLHTTLF